MRASTNRWLTGIVLLLSLSYAFAADGQPTAGVVNDSAGRPVKNSSAECWRTGLGEPAYGPCEPAGSATTLNQVRGRAKAAGMAPPARRAPESLVLEATKAVGNAGYLTDSDGVVVRSSQGECWHTGGWIPELANVIGCDGVLAKAVPVPAPAPSPTPAPVPATPALPSAIEAPEAPTSEARQATQTPEPPAPPPALTREIRPVEPVPTPPSKPLAASVPSENPPAAVAPGTEHDALAARPPVTGATPPANAIPGQATATPKARATERRPAPSSEKITLNADTYFDFDKASLKPEGRRLLDAIAERLGNLKLEVAVATGHTDWTGTNTYNQKLSERRALSVKRYLAEKGVPADRIFTTGKGETQPVASNATHDGRAKNRRVELELVGVRQQ